MSRPVILAADVGTSSLKAALVREDGAVLATARQSYGTAMPQNGCAEQDPLDWLLALERAVVDLGAKADLGMVAGVVVTGQMSGGLLVDAELAPLTPCLIWSDQRAFAQSDTARHAFGADALYRLTGNYASPTYTAPKLAWFARHAPDAYHQAFAFLQPKDWVVAQLTGKAMTDLSDASCTGLLDIVGGTWSDELMRLYGVDPRLAPEIVLAGGVAGALTPVAAQRLGLTQGLPVIMGGGDGPVSAAGVGALCSGDAQASLGTSAWISFVSDRPQLAPESGLVTYAHVLPGLFVETGSMQSAGAALEWAARLLETQPGTIAEMALKAAMPAADAPLFLPYIQGERAPWWFSHNGGTLIGLGRSHDREAVAAAVFEGVLFQLRLILDNFAQRGQRTSTLAVAGTFGTADAFAQRFADTTRQAIRPLRHAEHATAMGAAMLGFVGLGVLADLRAGRAWVQYEDIRQPGAGQDLASRRYELFTQSWPAIGDISMRLAELGRPKDQE